MRRTRCVRSVARSLGRLFVLFLRSFVRPVRPFVHRLDTVKPKVLCVRWLRLSWWWWLWLWLWLLLLLLLACTQTKMAATLMKTQPRMLPVVARRFAAKKVQGITFKEKQRLFSRDKRARKQVKRLYHPPTE